MLRKCLLYSPRFALRFALAVAVAATASPALAGPDGTYFDGAMTTYSATPECGERVGFSFSSTLRPAGLHNNSQDLTWFSLVHSRGAATVMLPKKGNAGTYAHGGVSSRGHQWWSEDPNLKFSKLKIKPKKIKQSTRTVTVEITLDKFWVIDGCKITFKGSFIANPNN